MSHDCQKTWERALDARRGELSGLERLRLEEELEGCERCARRSRRVCALLDEASADWSGLLEAPPDLDAGFAALMGRLEEAPAAVEARGRAASIWLLAAVVAAEVAVVGWGAWALWEAPSAREAAPQWARAVGTPPAVGVYADASARWTLEGDPAHALRLREGAALVDFVPVGQDTLWLRAGAVEVKVVGTVVYLSLEDPERPLVAVLAGAVEVSAPGQPPRLLREGEAAQGPALAPVAAPAGALQRADALIDLERHRRLTARLQRARAEAAPEAPAPVEVAPVEVAPVEVAPVEVAPAEVTQVTAPTRPVVAKAAPARRALAPQEAPAPVEAPAPEEAPAPVEAPAPSLQDQAREALRRDEHLRAAELHERWLAQVPPTSSQAATLRLELTRLYLNRLGRRRQAIGHLRGLLRDNPADQAAPQARRQLCELLGEEASDEPQCQRAWP